MSGRVLRLATALALLTGACADGSELPAGVNCSASTDCHEPLTCSFNQCVTPGANRLVLMARLTPPSSSGLLPQQVGDLALASGPDLLVELLPSARVSGVVTIDGDTFTVNVPGELEVRSADVIDGLTQRFTATSRVEVGTDGYGFTLVVLPGRSYAGTFRPADIELPAHHFTLDAAAVASGRFDIVLPARTSYGTVAGRVRTADGPKPILDARVVALGADDAVLGVTRTDPERGQFEMLLAPDVTSFRLKVESPPAGPVFPDFVTTTYTLGAEALDVIVPDPPADIAAYDAVLQVVGAEAADASPSPVEGLTVTLQGVLDGGTLRRTATTDAEGRATFRVLAGQYECVVIVPPGLPYASWHGLVDLAPQAVVADPTAWTVSLALRPTWSGSVRDAFGAAVPAGTLTFERRVQRDDGDLLALAPPAIDVELGADGAFSVRLDPGTWDVVIAPDAETGAPNAHEAGVVVGEAGLVRDIELPLPGLLHLTVAGPDGDFLAGVGVDLWLPGDDGPRLFASGTTNDRGFVDMLVPHADAR